MVIKLGIVTLALLVLAIADESSFTVPDGTPAEIVDAVTVQIEKEVRSAVVQAVNSLKREQYALKDLMEETANNKDTSGLEEKVKNFASNMISKINGIVTDTEADITELVKSGVEKIKSSDKSDTEESINQACKDIDDVYNESLTKTKKIIKKGEAAGKLITKQTTKRLMPSVADGKPADPLVKRDYQYVLSIIKSVIKQLKLIVSTGFDEVSDIRSDEILPPDEAINNGV